MPRNPFSRYVIAFMALLVVFIVMPVPLHYLKAMSGGVLGPQSDVVLTGASTIGQASECDTDRRSITAFLAQDLGRPVLDGSYPGLSVEAATNTAGVIAQLRNVRQVVLTSGWVDLTNSGTLSLHDYMFFRLLNGDLALDRSLLRITGLKSIFYNSETIHDPFSFGGQNYSGSDSFIPAMFVPETKMTTCPENDGHDLRSVKALYYHQMVQQAPRPELATLIVSLSRRLQAQDKQLVFALLPLNIARLGELDPAWPAIVRQRRDAFLGVLRDGGVTVLDMSEDLPKDAFATRWCGCTHYGQAGRIYVAQKIAQSLDNAPGGQNRLSLSR